MSTALGQGLGPLELDPDLDLISARLGLKGTGQMVVEEHWRDKDWQRVVAVAEAKLEADKSDFRGHALKYLAYLELKNDRKLATEIAVRALRDLSKKPIQLAKFIRRGLFSAPTTNDYQIALMAIIPVVADARKVHEVRVAHIRALLGCGKTKEAVVTNKGILKDLAADIPGLLELAKAICDSNNGRSMAMVAKKAVDAVIAKQGENTANLLVKYRVLHDLLGQEKKARELGKRIAQRVDASNLNDWLWYLMTRRESAGKYRALALQTARRLEQLTDLGFHEYDTIALALYRNGLIEEAAEYQDSALNRGGASDPDYRRRKKKYEKALKAKRAKKETGAKK